MSRCVCEYFILSSPSEGRRNCCIYPVLFPSCLRDIMRILVNIFIKWMQLLNALLMKFVKQNDDSSDDSVKYGL